MAASQAWIRILYGETEQGVTLVAFLSATLSERGVFIQSLFQARVFIASVCVPGTMLDTGDRR